MSPMENESTIRTKYIDDLSIAEAISMKQQVRIKPSDSIPYCNTYRERTGHILIKEDCVMTSHIRSLEEFASLHQMKVNAEKTKMVLFNPMKSIDVSPLGFKIDGKEIGSVEEFKLLGVMLSSNLSWNSHISYIIRKANSRVWTVKRMSDRGVAPEILIRIFELHVRSLLEYMAPAFTGAVSKKNIISIERVQKRHLRCILGRNVFKNRSYLEVCKAFGFETLEQRRTDLCITFVKRSIKDHPDLFPTVEQGRKTRLSPHSFLVVPKLGRSRSTRYENSARVFLPNLYNSHLLSKRQ